MDVKVYDEFYITKVGNNYDQWMLIGVGADRGQGDTIALYYGKYYAELAAEFLNQMVEEEFGYD